MNEEDVQQKAVDLLVAIGARPIRGGRLTLHFDGDGLLQNVEVNFTRKVRHAPKPHGQAKAELHTQGAPA